MELFVKICLKIKKDIFESLLTLFVKKDVVYHFPRRAIRYGICYALLPGIASQYYNVALIFMIITAPISNLVLHLPLFEVNVHISAFSLNYYFIFTTI